MGDLTNSYIPDAASTQGFVPEDKGILDYVNPFSDIKGLELEQDTNQADPVQDSLNKMASAPASATAQVSPTFFDWDKNNTDRYTNSAYYKELGFDPGVDNETKYGERQTWGNVIGNAIGGGAGLAWQTFKSGWEGWGNMANALFSWDSAKLGGDLIKAGVGIPGAADQINQDWDQGTWGDKLLGTSQDMQQYNDENNRILNKYAIFSTPESDKSVFNKQFFGNMLQQGGFMLGTLAQTASEEILTAGLSSEASLAKLGISTARFVDRGIELGETIKDFKKLGDIHEIDGVASNIWKGAQRLIPLSETANALVTASKAGAGALQMATIGVGGIKRAMSEANMAFTFARMLASGTYGDLSKKLTQEYIDSNGQTPVGDDLNKIQDYSQRAALSNFYIDSGLAALTQRIQFDSLFSKFDSSRNIVKQLGEFGDNTIKVTGEAGGVKGAPELTQVYDKGYFGAVGNYSSIATDFGKKEAAWQVAKSIGHGLMHWEIPSGIQMVLMDVSNNTMQDYYYDLYHGTKGFAGGKDLSPDMDKSFNKAVSNEYNNGQGVKSFLMGAVSGALLSPFTFGIEKGIERARIDPLDKVKIDADKAYTISTLNEYYRNPQIALKEVIASFKVHDAAAQSMSDALKNSDQYTYYNSKDSLLFNAVSAAKKTDMLPSLLDTIRSYANNIKPEEFKDAFGFDPTQENIKDTNKYISAIADRVESFSRDYEHLQDKYGDLVMPQLFPKGSAAEFQARVAKKALDDSLEVLATNRAKSERATERALGLMTEVGENKAMGRSSAEAFPILASETEVSNQTSILTQEISDLQANPKKTPDINEQIRQKQDQVDALNRWKEGWIFNGKEDSDNTSPKRSRDAVDGDKAKEAYKDYINSKNEEKGHKVTVSDDDVNSTFKNFQDYTDLNADHKEYIDAYNTLANPTKFVTYHGKLMEAIKDTLEKLHTEHLEELGLNRSDGLKSTTIGTPDIENPEKSTSGNITEGKEYFTKADPDSAWYNNKAVKRYNNDLIKIIKIDKGPTEAEDKITVQVNGDKTYVVRPDQLAKKGKLYDLATMTNDQKIYFKNRDKVIKLNVSSKYGKPHLNSGDHVEKDYSKQGTIVSARLVLEKEDGVDTLKIKYKNPVTGKETTVDYDRTYYAKYGKKGPDLRQSPTEAEGQDKLREERTQKNYATQYSIFEKRVEEATDKLKQTQVNRDTNAQKFDELSRKLEDHKAELELTQEELDKYIGKPGRKSNVRKALEKSKESLESSITETQDHIDSITKEKEDLDNTIEALKQAKEFYQDAGLELMDTGRPFSRDGQPNLSSSVQEQKEQAESSQLTKRYSTEDVEEFINDTQSEIDDISKKVTGLKGYISDIKDILSKIVNIKSFMDFMDLPKNTNTRSGLRDFIRSKIESSTDPDKKAEYQDLMNKILKGGKPASDILFLISDLRDSINQLADLEPKLQPAQEKQDRLYQALEEKQNISSLQDRIDFLNQVQDTLTQAHQDSQIQKGAASSITKPSPKPVAQDKLGGSVAIDQSPYDPDKAKLPKFEEVGFNKTFGRQYSNDKDQTPNTAYGEDRFFGFTAKQNVLNNDYNFKVVTEHNDEFGIRADQYNPKDIKVVLVKKQENGSYKYVDQDGKELDNPNKDNIIYTSLANADQYTPKRVRESYSVADTTSDEQIQQKIDEHKAYQDSLINRSKEGDIYLNAVSTSPGIQRVERTHEGKIAKAEVEGRVIVDDPDWNDLRSANNPENNIALRITTDPNTGSQGLKGIPTGRTVLHEYNTINGRRVFGDKVTRVFNRELTDEEKTKLTDVLARFSKLFNKKTSSAFSKENLTDKEEEEYTMLSNYIKNILPWSSDTTPTSSNRFFNFNLGLHVGDKQYPNTEQSIRDNSKDIFDGVYHHVNNKTLETRENFYDVKKNSDGTYSQGKEWDTYEHYLLDKREGEIPPVYTSLPRTDSGTPQRTQAYINWMDPNAAVPEKIPIPKKEDIVPAPTGLQPASKETIQKFFGGKSTEPVIEPKVETPESSGLQPATESTIKKFFGGNKEEDTSIKDKILEQNTEEAAKNTKPETQYPTGVTDKGETVHFTIEGAVATVMPKDGKLSADIYAENINGDIQKEPYLRASVDVNGNLSAARFNLQRELTRQLSTMDDGEESPFRLPIEQFEKTEDFQKLGDYISKNLPQFSVNKMLDLIHGKAWGMFKSNAIYVYENAGEGTGFHEAFHGVWNSYVTDKEQDSLVKEFQSRSGEFTNPYSNETKPYSEASLYDVKEMLADEFANYVSNGVLPESPKTKGFFQTLWEHIKSLFTLSPDKSRELYTNINRLFKGVDAGDFRNADPVREKSTLPEYKSVDGFSQEETAHAVEGLTYYMFQGLFSSGRNIDSILDNINPEESRKLLNDLYDAAHEQVMENSKKVGPKTGAVLLNQKYELWDEVRKSISRYGLDFSKSDALTYNEENTTNALGIRDSISIDPTKMTGVNVKLLLASLPDSKYVKDKKDPSMLKLVPERNLMNQPKLVDYNKTHNLLLNELSNLVPSDNKGLLETMLDKLDNKYKSPYSKLYKDGYGWIQNLRYRLKYEDTSSTRLTEDALKKDDVKIQIAFEKSFNNSKTIPQKTIVNEGGYLYNLNPVENVNTDRVKSEWSNRLKDNLDRTGNSLVRLNSAGIMEINRDSSDYSSLMSQISAVNKSSFDFSKQLDVLEKLGITFSSGKRDLNRFANTIGEDTSAILNQIKEENINTIDELYGNNIVGGRINNLLAIEAGFSGESNQLSYLNAEGMPQYSVTIPSLLSHTINTINSVKTREELVTALPWLGSVVDGKVVLNGYQANSEILKLDGPLFNKKGERKAEPITHQILSGIGTDEYKGTSSGELEFSERIADKIHYLLNNTVNSIINSDKSTENGFGIPGKPLISMNDISQILLGNPDKVVGLYTKHLTDEMYSAVYNKKYPSNIQYYKDSVSSLGHFKDILGKDLINQFQKEVISKTSKYKGNNAHLDFLRDNKADIDKAISDYLTKTLYRTSDFLKEQSIFNEKGKDGLYTTDAIDNESLTKILGYKEPRLTTIDYEKNGDPIERHGYSENDINKLAGFVAFNEEVLNTEQHKLIYGHPGFYKDLAKRANGAGANKEMMVQDPNILRWQDKNEPRNDGKVRSEEQHPSIKVYSFKDQEVISRVHQEIAEGMYKDMFTGDNKTALENKLGATFDDKGKLVSYTDKKALLQNYLKLNEADAMAYGMPDFIRDLLRTTGKLTKQQELQFDYEIAYEKVALSKRSNSPNYDKKELHDAKNLVAEGDPGYIFPVYKTQYFGYAQDPEMMHPVFLKHAVQPKFFRHVEGSQFEDVYLAAKSNQADILGFESGEKVGNIENKGGGFTPIYNEKGEPNLVNGDFPSEMASQKLYSRFMGIQVETSAEAHENTTRGTQVTKQVMSNFIENGDAINDDVAHKIDEYQNTLTQMMQLGKERLLRKVGLVKTRGGYDTDDLTSMVKTLREEAIKREMPDNVIEGISSLINPDGSQSLKYKFDTLVNREKIDNILNSIVDSSVISEKLHGTSAIQVASTMYESNPRDYMYLKDGKYVAMTKTAAKSLTPQERSSVRMTSSDLKFYTNAKGKITQAEIYTSWPFKNHIPEQFGLKLENGIYKLSGNPNIDKKLLSSLGFRIPTQGMNSIESLVIKGFTPRSNGDMVVVPSEIVGKAGSDFDIDKLNLYTANHHYDAKTNQLKAILWKGSQQKTRDYYSDLYDKGELLSPGQRKALDDYISQSKELLVDNPENRLLKSVTPHIFDPASLTNEAITSDFLDELSDKNKDKRDQVLDSMVNKALQNHYIDTMGDLVRDPSNYGQLVTPNSTDELKSLANEINQYKIESGTKDATQDEKSAAYLRSFEGSVSTRQKYLTAKRMVGIAAVNSTLHVMAQLSGLRLAEKFITDKIYYLTSKGEDKRVVTTKLGAHSPLEDGTRNIGHKNDVQGNSISDSMSQKLSGFVDGAKDPFVFDLNMNMNNSGTWFYMNHLGSSDRQIGYLYAQPILDKFFSEQSLNRSDFKSVNDAKDKVEDLFYKVVAPHFKDITGKDILSEMDYYKNDFFKLRDKKAGYVTELNEIADSIPKFSNEDLINNIKAGDKADSKFQIASLMHYLEMDAQSQLLSNFNQAIGYDNKKTRTIQENQNQVATWEKSLQEKFVANPDSILDETFLGEMKNQKEDVINMFSKYFVTLSPQIQKVFDPLLEKLSNYKYFSSKENKLDLLSRYNNFVVSYILHTTEANTGEGRVSLNQSYDELLKGKDSLAKQLLDYQKSSNYNISDNLLVKELLPLINSDTEKPDNISLFRNKPDTFKTNKLIESLDNLKNYAESSGDEKLSKFVNNLAKFSLIQSGLQNSKIDYRKILSTSVYSDYVNKVLDSFGKQDIDTDDVWKKFHQNNWNNQSVVPRAPIWVKLKQGIATIHENSRLAANDFITKTIRKPGYNQAMIDQLRTEKRSGEAFDNILLQKSFKNEKGYWIYTPIPKLGDGPRFTEIPTDRDGESILGKNNSGAKETASGGFTKVTQDMIDKMNAERGLHISDNSEPIDSIPDTDSTYKGDQPPVQGTNIYTGASDPLGRALTNPTWGSKKDGVNYYDVESEFKANASRQKAKDLNPEEALKYDKNLMYKLQLKKFEQNPELIDQINERGGLDFILASSHVVGVKNSRWEGLGEKSNFIQVLAKAYETFATKEGKFVGDHILEEKSPIDKLKENGTITTKDCN